MQRPPDSPRRRGRPPLDPNDSSVSVHLRVTPKLYDELYAQARVRRCSMLDLIRARIARYVEQTDEK
jgi:hypothetical protein